jgi:hypothetical protein
MTNRVYYLKKDSRFDAGTKVGDLTLTGEVVKLPEERFNKYVATCNCEHSRTTYLLPLDVRTLKFAGCENCKETVEEKISKAIDSYNINNVIYDKFILLEKHVKSNRPMWKLECVSCKAKLDLSARHVVLGKANCTYCTSCKSKHPFTDRSGEIIGNFKLLSRIPNTTNIYVCECQCESKTIKNISIYRLDSGSTKSCGCFKRERVREIANNKNKENWEKIKIRNQDKEYMFNCGAEKGYHNGHYADKFLQPDDVPEGEHILTLEEYKIESQKPCHYCGLGVNEVGVENSGFHFNGLDRIDSSIPHITSNLVTCCKTCNFAKMDSDYESFLNHIVKLKEFKEGVRRFKQYIGEYIHESKILNIHEDTADCECGFCGNKFSALLILLKAGVVRHCGCQKRKRITGSFYPGSILRQDLLSAKAKFRAYINEDTRIRNPNSKRLQHVRSTSSDMKFIDALRVCRKPCTYCGSDPTITGSRYCIDEMSSDRFRLSKFVATGIDRIDPALGHTKGNITSCCKRCNECKQGMTVDQFNKWIDLVFENKAKYILTMTQDQILKLK